MRDDKEKLAVILESIERIQIYTKDGKEAFLSDTKTQDAVVRNYQVIGEAVKELSEALKTANGDVEWREASRFRDKMIHHYLDIDYTIVWNAVANTLEPFRQKVSDIHKRLVYKVPEDRPSKLEEKLRSSDERDQNS